VRITTRFPFGLFVKAGRPALGDEVLVFPAVRPLGAAWLGRLGGAGAGAARRPGRGDEIHNLRAYRPGDDPRFIHWRSSAKAETLMVREHEADASHDARLVLVGRGQAGSERLEAALSDAASVASALIRAGAGVEMTGPDLVIPLGHGRSHLRRVLAALALYDPAGGGRVAPRAAGEDDGALSSRRLREIRFSLD
jgi:uncharacterized protein (DUF58 family)